MAKFHKDVFESWIRDQIDAWIGEYDAWDMLIEDGDITEEDWEYIRSNLSVESITIKDSGE